MKYDEKEIFDLLAEEEQKDSSDKLLPKDRQNMEVLRFLKKFDINPFSDFLTPLLDSTDSLVVAPVA